MECLINETLRTAKTEVRMMTVSYTPNKVYTNNHFHSHAELHCITEGSTVFKINFHEEISVNEGEWILIGAGVYHEELISLHSSGFCIDFDIKSGEEHFFAEGKDHDSIYLKGCSSDIQEISWRLFHEIEDKKAGYEDCCRALFVLLLTSLQRYNVKNETVHIQKKNGRHDAAYIADAYFNRVFNDESKELFIDDLARQLNVSRRHVNRILKERFGMTFAEKLMDMKVQYARFLLENTNLSVQEISEKCSITAACLIKNFKQKYQITPLKYRKLNERGMM